MMQFTEKGCSQLITCWSSLPQGASQCIKLLFLNLIATGVLYRFILVCYVSNILHRSDHINDIRILIHTSQIIM